MQTRALERGIFNVFLDLSPAFRARIAGPWDQPLDDTPDVAFVDISGAHVGVEFESWINAMFASIDGFHRQWGGGSADG
jgi:hypothetical protein